MFRAIADIFKILSTIVLMGILVIAVGVAVNADFRNKLEGYVESYLSDWLSSRRMVTDLRAELATNHAENSMLKAKNDELVLNFQVLSSNYEKTAEVVEAERNKLDSEFRRLESELEKEVSSREIAIEKVLDKYTVIRVGDKILFDTGRSEIKARGQEVLSLIAGTLNKFSGRQIRVEGHTDNLPIVSTRIKKLYPTNWELSSARATSAVRFLIENGGLDAQWVVAVGNGEHHPVASNKTSEGRTKNRRIEIVLMPADDKFKVKNL